MKPIVLATDGSPSAAEVTLKAVNLARTLGAPLVVVAVEHVDFPMYGYYGYTQILADVTEIERDHVRKTLVQARAVAAEALVECETVHATGPVVDAVCGVADLSEYGAVVLGGALYMGRWHRGARGFLDRHREALAELPFAVFALGPPSLDKADDSRAQLQRALDHAHVTPDAVAIFGGVIDPANLRFPFNRLPKTDERDWRAIERWAVDVLQLVEREPALAIPHGPPNG